MMAVNERQRVMNDERPATNDRRSSIPFVASSYENLVSLVRARAVQRGEAIAYTFLEDGENQEVHLTYAALDQEARAVAARLQRELRPGDRAILIYPTGTAFITAFMGCLYAGVVAVPVPEPFSDRHFLRIKNIVGDAQTRHILTTERFRTAVNQRFAGNPEMQALRWLPTDTIDVAEADAWQETAVTGATLAFIQYTSGSTAVPKGVMVSHRALLTNSEMIQNLFQSDENTVMVTWVPLFHDLGLVGNIVQTAYTGGRCILLSPLAFLQKPFRWLQAISRYRGEISGGPDFCYALTARKVTEAQKASLDLSSWHAAFNGAEPVRPVSLEQFSTAFAACGFRRESLLPGLGIAEATMYVSAGPLNHGPIYYRVDAAAYGQRRVVPARQGAALLTLVACGRTDWVDQQVKIVNPETLKESAADEVGEIWLAGSHIAQGYWNKPAETEATFHAYVADSGEGPFMRTGDLGFVHEGQLYVGGRIKDLIIIDGENHYPQDIELTTENAHPAVRKGCTAAFAIDQNGQERLVVVAELNPPGESEPPLVAETIAQEIRRAIATEHGIPLHDVAFIKARTIHKTSSGKIQRHANRADYLRQQLAYYPSDA
jgi:acyl-CoA synthetase (AMP-forming)/AMP-acid ligase II